MVVDIEPPGTGLQRTIGFRGLMFVSLGSIIGSGWLLSALTATQAAGPAAIISWMLAAVMLTAGYSGRPYWVLWHPDQRRSRSRRSRRGRARNHL